ncbi:LysR family transcriptional regulator [Sporosarcina sp. Sa2YVA2]|uniref:LysR family transcriptional regulator n=1 Tax=Sporosarcina quadrami TaxID=2762234 RepID=A0ABR8U7H7_9BACL|nr:LysR family transcriptional regulator [Sporosarcina quadrami]MBD7983992.1 LysR family transcriptional regulator [Sporosarcina quadrami]
MDLDQIKAFLTIAETRNFTKAAEILHIAQSSITTRIRVLEQIVGKPLFTRTNKRVTLSRAGELFYTYAERINSLAETGIETIRLEDRFSDKLVIGGPSSIWNYNLNEAIVNFKMSHPEIALDLMAHTNEKTIQKVIDGTIDIGIVYSRPRHPMVNHELIQEDYFILVGRDPSKLIDIQSLKSGGFLFVDWGHPFATWFEELVGARYVPGFKINQTALVVNYLMNGDFFGFVPKSFVDSYLQKGDLFELDHDLDCELPAYTIYAVYLKSKKGTMPTELGLGIVRK